MKSNIPCDVIKVLICIAGVRWTWIFKQCEGGGCAKQKRGRVLWSFCTLDFENSVKKYTIML